MLSGSILFICSSFSSKYFIIADFPDPVLPSRIDLLLFISSVGHDYQAKHKVFFVDHEYQQKNHQLISPGELVKHEYQADVKVFVVSHDYQATIKIMRKNFPS